MTLARSLTETAWTALGGDARNVEFVRFEGEGDLPAAFAVTDLASAAIATATLAVAEFAHQQGARCADVTVDRRLSAMWFAASLRPIDWQRAAVWEALSGDYVARDGWIRLHTNAAHHRAAALRVLGVAGERSRLEQAVARWPKADLERAVVEAGGCAAEMRTLDEWRHHPQGRAVAGEPLVHIHVTPATSMPPPTREKRPLHAVRVLDLTRVLAGPVASRLLAGYGAQVLRIDPPDWDEPGVVPEVTLGKRCARLELRSAADRAVFEALLSGAHVLLHGYRPGALEHLGYDAVALQRMAPGLIDVALDAYGWSGAWSARRGFDSLVQMSTGIADFGMRRAATQRPTPLPVQALDHATGYFLAAAVMRGLTLRMRQGVATRARLSLARTAELLTQWPLHDAQPVFAEETHADQAPAIESTAWGKARRLRPPAQIAGVPMHWDLPACPLGSAAPCWLV